MVPQDRFAVVDTPGCLVWSRLDFFVHVHGTGGLPNRQVFGNALAPKSLGGGVVGPLCLEHVLGAHLFWAAALSLGYVD